MAATATKTPKTRLIRESTVISKPSKVDREAGVMEDVKIVGLQAPKKNRRYEPQALKEAANLYERTKVNLNHQSKEDREPRKIEDRIGLLEGVYFKEGDGLYAKTFRFNPKHPAAESLAWWAEYEPSGVGFSHVVKGDARLIGGTEVVESIREVMSVDLVADPATTRGLFESEEPMEGDDVKFEALTIDEIKKERPDLIEALTKQATEGTEAERLKAENKRLSEAIAKFEESAKRAERTAKAKKACVDAKLPAQAITELFIESLVGAAHDKWEAMIDDRKALVGSALVGSAPVGGTKPLSMEQRFAEASPIDESAFGPARELSGDDLAAFYGV